MDTEMNMITDDKLREILKDMIFQAVPEQREELERVWDEYSPQFDFATDKPGFEIQGTSYFGRGQIVLTNRSMTSLWLLGFASGKSACAYSDVLDKTDTFDYSRIQAVPQTRQDEADFSSIIRSAEELLNIENLEDFNWPPKIPLPTGVRPDSDQEAVVHDLISMATAYIFLHEVQHIQYHDADLTPHEEELGCDKYARELMFERIEEFAKTSGDRIDLLKTKRGMAVAMASFFIFVHTSKKDWAGTESHPALMIRMKAFSDYIDTPENDAMWTFFASLLIGYLSFHNQITQHITYKSQKELCLQLIEQLPA
jgi:hypothetical protein